VRPFGTDGPQIGPGLLAGFTLDGQPLGAVGLALGAGLAAWIELFLLRRALQPRIGSLSLGMNIWARMFGAAGAAAAAGWGVRLLLPELHPIIVAVLVLGTYGVTYFLIAALLGMQEARAALSRVLRLVGGR
jgi:putative peptidoglycan lipid II flippase